MVPLRGIASQDIVVGGVGERLGLERGRLGDVGAIVRLCNALSSVAESTFDGHACFRIVCLLDV